MEDDRRGAGYGNLHVATGGEAGAGEIIREFRSWYTCEEIQVELLDLLLAAINSEEAENWDHFIRGRLIFLYRQLSRLIGALYYEYPPETQNPA